METLSVLLIGQVLLLADLFDNHEMRAVKFSPPYESGLLLVACEILMKHLDARCSLEGQGRYVLRTLLLLH
jgi:hypothetical protein